MKRRAVSGLAAVVGLAFVVGCDGGGGGRCMVSGSVKLDGKDLDLGVVMFQPMAQERTQASAVITNGKYAIPAAQGLWPGKYRVALSAPDGRTPVDPNAAPGPSGNFASKDRIPAKFNTASTFEVEIKQGGQNKFDFNVP